MLGIFLPLSCFFARTDNWPLARACPQIVILPPSCYIVCMAWVGRGAIQGVRAQFHRTTSQSVRTQKRRPWTKDNRNTQMAISLRFQVPRHFDSHSVLFDFHPWQFCFHLAWRFRATVGYRSDCGWIGRLVRVWSSSANMRTRSCKTAFWTASMELFWYSEHTHILQITL